MPKADAINRSDELFAAQLLFFKRAIGDYAATLGLSPAQIASQAADADFYGYVSAIQRLMQNGGQSWTSYKAALRRGPETAAATVPSAPTFPPAVAPVAMGVEARFRGLLRVIKANANYNEGIGRALGIEGAERAAPDVATVQPELGVTINGGKVEVDWGWGGHAAHLDMIEIRVDRGDGQGAIFLAHDTTPGYTDSAPFPATPAKWTYTAIYWLDDHAVGQWSDPVSVVVGG